MAKKNARKWIAFLPITLIVLVSMISSNIEAQFVSAQIELNVTTAQTHAGNTNTTTTSVRYSNLVTPSSLVSTYMWDNQLLIAGQVQNNFTFPIQAV